LLDPRHVDSGSILIHVGVFDPIAQRSIRSQGVKIWNNLAPIFKDNIGFRKYSLKEFKFFLPDKQNVLYQ